MREKGKATTEWGWKERDDGNVNTIIWMREEHDTYA